MIINWLFTENFVENDNQNEIFFLQTSINEVSDVSKKTSNRNSQEISIEKDLS